MLASQKQIRKNPKFFYEKKGFIFSSKDPEKQKSTDLDPALVADVDHNVGVEEEREEPTEMAESKFILYLY